MASPFRKPLELAAGDFAAKALYFLTFIFLARVLGVEQFGIVEFANALLMYFVLFADAGLEAWGVREIAQGREVRDLAARVTVLRILVAGVAFGLLLCVLPLLPEKPPLRLVLAVFGLGLFSQAVSLKWVFMGEQQMTAVAAGLVVGQLVFTGTALAVIHGPTGILWVPVLKLVSDVASAAYFARRFAKQHGALVPRLQLLGAGKILRPASILGLSAAFHLMNYNFDTVMLGFMVGATTVGWYSAAYKPVTVALALPMTYFVGLYPGLARSYAQDKEEFRSIVSQSLRLTATIAIPLGVGGAMLARPIVVLLFGPTYEPSIAVLRILVWSAVFVILRGTFHNGLKVANRAGVELRCAMGAAAVNCVLNIALIPRYGMIGAAAATLVAELLWLGLLVNRLNHYVINLALLPYLWRPCLAGVAMSACLWFAQPVFWIARALLGVGVYFGVVLLLSGPKGRRWLKIFERPAENSE